ncbi:MAG: 2-amino-4-hydroxy-6-hydroxymethyldihydropteridine diphosphokinase [Spirochaetes bacterium]|nr:2-amino-4-hydroxy-6-hydroxymethyldihydropteridine diphosphokinase [Spirochaetota bacterium]
MGLGSNLGDRYQYLAKARCMLANLEGFRILSESSIEETDPVGYVAQPKFLNQVIMGVTEHPPEILLRFLLSIEAQLGRTRTIKMGPRVIDLDILLYEGVVVRTDELTIPHPEIRNRPFVMKQLLELDETLIDPTTGEKYMEVYKNATNHKY